MRVLGPLDLRYVTIPFPLYLRRCRFDSVDLTDIVCPVVDLAMGWASEIIAARARISAVLGLFGARIDTQIVLGNAHLGSLQCGATYIGDILLGAGIVIDGDARFAVAKTDKALARFHLNGPLVAELLQSLRPLLEGRLGRASKEG